MEAIPIILMTMLGTFSLLALTLMLGLTLGWLAEKFSNGGSD